MLSTQPVVSIILPTWNGARDLERLLPALRSQVGVDFELVAIDSSSSDSSASLLRAAGAQLEVIPQSDFGHGATRNRGAARAKGSILVFLSQDAVPTAPDFLARMVECFDDPRVAGASARVLPGPDDDPLTARTVLSAPEAGAQPILFEAPLNPSERPLFNDVASAMRASVWRELPFPAVSFGEDLAWAERALAAGHRLVFQPEAAVFHAHRYGPKSAFERYRVDAAFHREARGVRLRPSLTSVLRGFARAVLLDVGHCLREGPSSWAWVLASPFLRGGEMLGQYRGSRGPLGPLGPKAGA